MALPKKTENLSPDNLTKLVTDYLISSQGYELNYLMKVFCGLLDKTQISEPLRANSLSKRVLLYIIGKYHYDNFQSYASYKNWENFEKKFISDFNDFLDKNFKLDNDLLLKIKQCCEGYLSLPIIGLFKKYPPENKTGKNALLELQKRFNESSEKEFNFRSKKVNLAPSSEELVNTVLKFEKYYAESCLATKSNEELFLSLPSSEELKISKVDGKYKMEIMSEQSHLHLEISPSIPKILGITVVTLASGCAIPILTALISGIGLLIKSKKDADENKSNMQDSIKENTKKLFFKFFAETHSKNPTEPPSISYIPGGAGIA